MQVVEVLLDQAVVDHILPFLHLPNLQKLLAVFLAVLQLASEEHLCQDYRPNSGNEINYLLFKLMSICITYILDPTQHNLYGNHGMLVSIYFTAVRHKKNGFTVYLPQHL